MRHYLLAWGSRYDTTYLYEVPVTTLPTCMRFQLRHYLLLWGSSYDTTYLYEVPVTTLPTSMRFQLRHYLLVWGSSYDNTYLCEVPVTTQPTCTGFQLRHYLLVVCGSSYDTTYLWYVIPVTTLPTCMKFQLRHYLLVWGSSFATPGQLEWRLMTRLDLAASSWPVAGGCGRRGSSLPETRYPGNTTIVARWVVFKPRKQRAATITKLTQFDINNKHIL